LGASPLSNEEYEPGIIFGAGNKMRYYGPFLRLFEEFVESVRRARYVITLGYRYRDAHVNDVLRIWAADSVGYDYTRQKKMIVGVGPDSPARLPDLVQPFKTYDHLSLLAETRTAADAIPTIFRADFEV